MRYEENLWLNDVDTLNTRQEKNQKTQEGI